MKFSRLMPWSCHHVWVWKSLPLMSESMMALAKPLISAEPPARNQAEHRIEIRDRTQGAEQRREDVVDDHRAGHAAADRVGIVVRPAAQPAGIEPHAVDLLGELQRDV
jgi:hypothetical protein